MLDSSFRSPCFDLLSAILAGSRSVVLTISLVVGVGVGMGVWGKGVNGEG